MAITRRVVLEELAAVTDADRGETTTRRALVRRLDTDERTIDAHLDGLAACDLVRTYPDGRVRITITGDELLQLETDEFVIVQPE